MKKKNICFLLIILVVLMVPDMVTYASSSAKTLAQLRQELANLKAQKTANTNKKNQTQSSINNAKNSISEKHNTIIANQQTIIEKQAESEELEVEISNGKEQLESLLEYYQYIDADNIYLEYIFDATSYEDLVYRYSVVEQLTDYENDKINEWNQKIEENTQLKAELEQMEITLNQEIDNLTNQIDSLGNSLTELNDMAMDIDAEITSVQNSINYYVSIGCGENEQLDECLKVYGDSNFRRPLVKGVITSAFGYRTHPVTGKTMSFHSGTDIGVAEGTNVYSTANGTVTKIINRSSCGGNVVYIQHLINGKKYTSTYMHLLKINVKVGDKVTNETVIGLSGGYSTATRNGGYDACTTGGHLHFSLATGWYGTDYLAYNAWISHLIDPKQTVPLPNSWTSR